jgi:hypothetical protein
MIDNNLIERIVNDLRGMAIAGGNVPALLRHIQRVIGYPQCGLISVKCFRQAFGAGVTSIKPIGGWRGFGGELTDEQVENFVGPILRDYRASQEAATVTLE